MTDSHSTLETTAALDAVRPPEETLVKSYNINTNGEWEEVHLEELTPVSNIPDTAHPSARILSLEQQNENHDFVVVKRAYNPDTPNKRFITTDIDWNGKGFMKLFAPEYEVTDYSLQWEDTDAFATWQAAEHHIATTLAQPDQRGEIIQPVSANAFIYDVQAFLSAVKNNNDVEKDIHRHRFHKHTPVEDNFYAYRDSSEAHNV